MISAGNEGNDVDITKYQPCAIDAPNVLCVAATDFNDELAEWSGDRGGSNFGSETVHLAAPGWGILYAEPPRETLFFDDFSEPIAGRWESGGEGNQWDRTDEFASSGAYSVADSPGMMMAPGSDTWLRTTEPIDLTDRVGCQMAFAVRADMQSKLLVAQTSTGQTWIDRAGVGGFALTQSTGGEFLRGVVPLTREAEAEDTFIGFRLQDIPNTPPANGVYIDEVEVTCAGAVSDGDGFVFGQGTSYAAPHVAGVAALVMSARPDLSAIEVRDAIMTGVQKLPSLEGRVLTGGRLDAVGALSAAGAMTTGASATSDQPGNTSGTMVELSHLADVIYPTGQTATVANLPNWNPHFWTHNLQMPLMDLAQEISDWKGWPRGPAGQAMGGAAAFFTVMPLGVWTGVYLGMQNWAMGQLATTGVTWAGIPVHIAAGWSYGMFVAHITHGALMGLYLGMSAVGCVNSTPLDVGC